MKWILAIAVLLFATLAHAQGYYCDEFGCYRTAPTSSYQAYTGFDQSGRFYTGGSWAMPSGYRSPSQPISTTVYTLQPDGSWRLDGHYPAQPALPAANYTTQNFYGRTPVYRKRWADSAPGGNCGCGHPACNCGANCRCPNCPGRR